MRQKTSRSVAVSGANHINIISNVKIFPVKAAEMKINQINGRRKYLAYQRKWRKYEAETGYGVT